MSSLASLYELSNALGQCAAFAYLRVSAHINKKTMDEEAFQRELGKYPVVRSSTWRQATDVEEKVRSENVPVQSSMAAFSPVNVQHGNDSVLEHMEGICFEDALRLVGEQHLSQVDWERVIPSWRENFESKLKSMSLDDMERMCKRLL